MVDYSHFYSRSFNIKDKFTTRLHFFSAIFSKEDIKKLLIECNEKILKKINDTYLGFVVIKPIFGSNGDPLIGRTILKTYSLEDNGEFRYFVIGCHNVSFFGIPLKIKSLPFQPQDEAVGACATAACWIASHSLSDLFGIPKYSPFEVTEKSVAFPFPERNYPSEGLSLYQMKNYFNSIGLETEFIDVRNIQKYTEYTPNDDIVADVVKAYTKMGLPIIATLKLVGGNNRKDFHAVVISGYRHKHGILKEFYVHDDRIGPYSKAFPKGKFDNWDNEWIRREEFSNLFVDQLVIPIYPKIRLSFARIYNVFLKKHRRTVNQLEPIIGKFTPALYLMEIRRYKKFLWQHSCENKEEILCKHLPRFLWIIRYAYHGIPKVDYVYDGTSVFPTELCVIDF